MKKLAVLLVVMLASVGMLSAQSAVTVSNKGGWQKVGECKADFKKESESISLMGKDEFKSIKLKVINAPINISKVIVVFEDQTTQELPVNGALAAGSESTVLELQGPKDIKMVTFSYKPEPNAKQERAQIELYAMK